MESIYDDYVEIGNMKIGDTIKFSNHFYKITGFTGTNKELSLFCEPTKKTNNYIDLNHAFIRVNKSAYELKMLVPLNDKKFEIRYKLFCKA